MTNRVTLSDIDGRMESRAQITPLPDGYRFFHSSVYEWRKIGVKCDNGGAVVGESNGTKREVYDMLSYNSRYPDNWAASAWHHAITRAEDTNQRVVTGKEWTVRITPKYFFVSFDDGKVKPKTSHRLPRSTNVWEITRIIITG